MKPGEIFQFGDFQLDVLARTLRRREDLVTLNRRAFDVLLYLVQNPGRVLTRDELLKKVWPDTFVDENSLAQSISALRRSLEERPGDNSYIVTLPGRGYQFVSPVKILPSENLVIVPDAEAGDNHDVGTLLQRETIRTSITRQEQEVPAIPDAVRGWIRIAAAMLVLLVAGYVGWRHFRPQPPPSRVMLAVLPFQNLTGDPEQEFFADGLTEEMITKLGQLHPEQLGIIARTSVIGYKHSDKRLDQIARELSVQYVLEGSFRRAADHLRITAQLIRVDDQSHLWAADYDRQMEDIVRVQDDVAMAVAQEIQLRLTAQQRSSVSSARAVNPEAYEAYLKGRFFWNQRTEAGFRKAIEYFETAIAKDPNYAQAYSGLADAYLLLAGYQFEPEDQAMPKAKAAALQAIAINQNLAEAYTSLGLIYLQYEYKWAEAEASFKRAIELNPNYSIAHHFYGDGYLWAVKRPDEAISELRKAQQLDPLSLVIAVDLARRLCEDGKFDEGMRHFQEVLDIDPDFVLAHLYRSEAYVLQKRYPEALADIEQAKISSSLRPYVVRLLGVIYAYQGKRQEALEIIGQLKERSKHSYVDPGNIAYIYAALGENEEALNYLQQSYEQHSSFMSALKCDPMYDPLRSDPRFVELVRKVGIP